MKDLTKILCSYLPDGLKVVIRDECCDSPDGIDYSIKNIEGIYDNTVLDDFSRDYFFNEIMLILRPLSQLTKPIKEGGKEFVPIEELLKIKYSTHYEGHKNDRYSDIEITEHLAFTEACFKYMATLEIRISNHLNPHEEYWIVEKLHEWHFDLYGIIESNKAISIEDLQYNPYE